MMPTEARPDEPVRKSITVNASVDHAFRVFTEGFHMWWPSSHHAGPAPLKKAVIEGHAGGRCYSEQTDGTECDDGAAGAPTAGGGEARCRAGEGSGGLVSGRVLAGPWGPVGHDKHPWGPGSRAPQSLVVRRS